MLALLGQCIYEFPVGKIARNQNAKNEDGGRVRDRGWVTKDA
jgi:hypothetical protein